MHLLAFTPLPDRQDRVLHAIFARRKRGLVKRVPLLPFVVSTLGVALALAGGVLEARHGGFAEDGVAGRAYGEGIAGAARRRARCVKHAVYMEGGAPRSLATRYDHPSRVRIFTLFPRILSSLVIRQCHTPGRGFARSRCLFSTAYVSPTLFSRVLSFRWRRMCIWADPARCARPWGSTTPYPRSFFPEDLLPALPSRSGRRVLFHLCRGSSDYLLWEEMSLPPAYGHHHDLAFAPSSPIDLPYPRPALTSPVCSAPGPCMRSPYRRTCTVCVRIPVRIPLCLTKHRTAFESKTALQSTTISYRLPLRTGRSCWYTV
ncbi:hypothetical protein DFH08DRAFT_159706 [Mycena albidolilacea]|uniref:Uncharacterized protein n=1 Tax=Mycena albidolilacea TaxID=1033008 RepID=A0AAD7A0Z3_9AGAR|nr:hypothetical protein DFH08DRAFT_159706 [Mycena albidolilacea]